MLIRQIQNKLPGFMGANGYMGGQMTHRRPYGSGRELALIGLILLLFVVPLAGCSSGSGSDTAGTPGQETPGGDDGGPYTGKAIIESSTGGAITVETGDGTQVTLDIPGGALQSTQDVTLTVTVSDSGSSSAKGLESASELAIAIEPSTLLLESAQLNVNFPADRDGSGLVLGKNDGTFTPMKQSMASGTLTGTLYALTDVRCIAPADETLIDSAYALINQPASRAWQDAHGVFDALVWLSMQLSQRGYPAESKNCFSAVYEQGRESAQAFVLSMSDVEKGEAEYHAVEKFKRLMALCENPDNIIMDLNALIESDE
jgi:hypothetical protein